jgi:hypothetical protein
MSVATLINPWSWSKGFGCEQATLVERSTRTLRGLMVELEATAYG